MIYHCKQIVFIILGFMLFVCIVLSGCMQSSEIMKPVDGEEYIEEIGFYKLFEIDKNNITRLYVGYLGVEVELAQEYATQILESFDFAKCNLKMKDSPFRVSEYTLSMEYAGERIILPICWFNGKKYEEGNIEYTDRRFDVYYDGFWYSFDQNDTVFWNEDKLVAAFEECCKQSKVKIPNRYEVEGYDQNADLSNNGRESAYKYNISEIKLEEVLDTAEYVVKGVSLGYDEWIEWEDEDVVLSRRVFKFQIDECYKGDFQNEEIVILPMRGVRFVNGTSHIQYPFVETPDLIEGETYLLCLEKSPVEGYFVFTNEFEGCAIVFNDVTYPRYNTEYHPFYKVRIGDIREYCCD